MQRSRLIPQLVHERKTGFPRATLGNEERHSIPGFAGAFGLERLAGQSRDDLAHGNATLRGKLSGDLDEILIEVQGGPHIWKFSASYIKHQASGIRCNLDSLSRKT